MYYAGHATSLSQTDETAKRLSKEQLGELWKALIMLPELDQMEVVIAGGMRNLILQNEELIYSEIWKQTAPKAQLTLKLLKIVYGGVEQNEDYRLLSEMTQTLLFTNKP